MEEKKMTMEHMETELKPLYIKATITRILTWCAVAVAIFMAVTADLTIALFFLVIALVLGIQRILATKRIGEIRKNLEKTATTKQIEANLKFLRIKVTIYRIITHSSLAAMILSLPITENLLIFMVFLIIAVVFGIPTGRAVRKRDEIQNLLRESVIEEVIREVLGDAVEYNQVGALTPGGVVVPFHYEYSNGDHHIKTVYNGVNIELGNISLYEQYEDFDDVAYRGYQTNMHFRGPWLICDFGKKPDCEVYISEWTNKDRKVMKSNVKIDNVQFGSRFCVIANAPQEAQKILTPQMMESISDVADKSGGTVYMSFLPDGKTHVGIQTGNNFFEPGKCYDAEGLRQKFLEELRRLTDIIDTLNV